jgi:hypothetical protein
MSQKRFPCTRKIDEPADQLSSGIRVPLGYPHSDVPSQPFENEQRLRGGKTCDRYRMVGKVSGNPMLKERSPAGLPRNENEDVSAIAARERMLHGCHGFSARRSFVA